MTYLCDCWPDCQCRSQPSEMTVFRWAEDSDVHIALCRLCAAKRMQATDEWTVSLDVSVAECGTRSEDAPA